VSLAGGVMALSGMVVVGTLLLLLVLPRAEGGGGGLLTGGGGGSTSSSDSGTESDSDTSSSDSESAASNDDGDDSEDDDEGDDSDDEVDPADQSFPKELLPHWKMKCNTQDAEPYGTPTQATLAECIPPLNAVDDLASAFTCLLIKALEDKRGDPRGLHWGGEIGTKTSFPTTPVACGRSVWPALPARVWR